MSAQKGKDGKPETGNAKPDTEHRTHGTGTRANPSPRSDILPPDRSSYTLYGSPHNSYSSFFGTSATLKTFDWQLSKGLLGNIGEMLDKDGRLTDEDRERIILLLFRKVLYAPIGESTPSQREGDIVREVVEEYLAKKNGTVRMEVQGTRSYDITPKSEILKGKGWHWARKQIKANNSAKPQPDANAPTPAVTDKEEIEILRRMIWEAESGQNVSPSPRAIPGCRNPVPDPSEIKLPDFMLPKTKPVERTVSADELAKRRTPDKYPLKDNPDASMTPEEYERFIRESRNPFVPKPTRIVFDPKTGKPVPEGWTIDGGYLPYPKGALVPPQDPQDIGLSPEQVQKKYEKWWQDAAKGDQSRRMMDKDPALTDDDKRAIAKAVEARFGEVGQDGKTIGDIVGEEVRKYLSHKGEPTLQTRESKMDPEAAVMVLARYSKAMFLCQRDLLFGYPGIARALAENPEAPVLAALAAIPRSRMDERVLGYATVRDIIRDVVNNALHAPVLEAARELLK